MPDFLKLARAVRQAPKAGHALEDMVTTLGGLPRAGVQDILPTAQREANLASFLEPSKEKRTMYHGTARDIKAFKPKQANSVFVSPEPNFADWFAEMSGKWMTKHENANEVFTPEQLQKVYQDAEKLIRANVKNPTVADYQVNQLHSGNFKRDSNVAEWFEEAAKNHLPSNQNVLPVHVQVENPFDYENPEHIKALQGYEEVNRYSPKSISHWMDEVPKGDWASIETDDIQNALKELGHDSFYAKEFCQKNLGIYDPKKVKSAIGNKGTYDTTKADINEARGGQVHMQVGGLTALQKLGKAGAKLTKQEEATLRGARALGVPGVDFADPLNPNDVMRMSEALGNAGAEGKTLNLTQADRSRVFGPNKGGTGFSGLQLTDPAYEAASPSWGVGKQSHLTRLINANTPDTIWSTFVGSPTQHMSNPVTVQRMYEAHRKAKPSAELVGKMNEMLNKAVNKKGNPVFAEGIDISDPSALDKAQTFDQRKLLAQAMTIGGEKKGEQATQDAFKIISEETDPLLKDAPTYAVGNRLWTIDEDSGIFRPDLNSAFPYQTVGTDMGLIFEPTEIELAAPDFVSKYKGRLNKKGDPQPMGHKDLTATTPRQFISEEYLTNLQKAGRKKGGAVGNPHKDFHLKMKDGGYTWTTKDSPHVEHFDKGGLSAKDLSSGPSTVAPQLFGDTIDYISDKLKKQLGEEKSVLSTPAGVKDVALRAASFPIGSMGDLASLADLVQTKIPGLYDEKKGSVLDPDKAPSAPYRDNREEPIRTPKLPVSAIVTSPTSQDIQDSFKQAGFLGDKEAPISELALALLGPSAATKAIKAAPKVARAAESGLNTATSAVNRPFTPATFTVEATAPDLGQGTSYGFRQGLNDRLLSDPKLGTKKPTAREGQGTYVNTKGELELNPLQAIDVPRAGNIGEGAKANAALRQQVAQMGTDLNQEAMAGHRFLPMMTNNIKDASSMLIKTKEGLSKEQIADLARALGNDMVVTHNPKLGGVVVYPFGPVTKGQIPEEFLTAQSAANKVLGKDAKIQFGKSDYAKDRLYMGKDEYAKAGASPMSAEQQALREKIQGIEKFMFPESVSGIPGSVKASPIGGLQPWSRGAEYPTSVIGIGNGSKVEYQPVNFLTDAKGKRYPTYREAEQERSKMLEGWHRTLPSRVR